MIRYAAFMFALVFDRTTQEKNDGSYLIEDIGCIPAWTWHCQGGLSDLAHLAGHIVGGYTHHCHTLHKHSQSLVIVKKNISISVRRLDD